MREKARTHVWLGPLSKGLALGILVPLGGWGAIADPPPKETKPGFSTENEPTNPAEFFENEIVARVNRSVITRQEIEDALQSALRRLGTPDPRIEFELKIRELMKLILEKIKDDAAVRYKDVVQTREVERMIEERMKEAGSPEEFRSALSEKGITLDELKRDLSREVAQQNFLRTQLGLRAARRADQRTKYDVQVSPGEIREYYESHPEEFFIRARAHVRRLYVSAKKLGGVEKALEEVARVRQEVLDGGDFAEICRSCSHDKNRDGGGDLGWIEDGDDTHAREIVDFALRGPVNKPSRVFRVPLGFFLLFVDERIEGGLRGFGEVQDEIRKVIWQRKAEAVFRRIEMELIEEAFIYPPEIKDLLTQWLGRDAGY